MAVKRISGQDTLITHYDSAELGITAFDVDAASQTGAMTTGYYIDCANAKSIVGVIAKTGTGTTASLGASIQFFHDDGSIATEKLPCFTAGSVAATDPLKILFGISEAGFFATVGTIGAFITGSAAGGVLVFPKCRLELTTGSVGAGTALASLSCYVKR